MIMVSTINSIGIALVITLFVIGVFLIIMNYYGKGEEKGSILSRVLKNEKGHPSLSLLQFLIWTMVISFVFMLFSLIRILSGEWSSFPFEEFPASLIALMGLSAIVPIAKGGMNKIKESNEPEGQKGEALNESPNPIYYKDNASLTRFQMLLWTIISVAIYITIVISQLVMFSQNLDTSLITMPDIDPILLALMGISQFGFLGGAAVSEGKKNGTG